MIPATYKLIEETITFGTGFADDICQNLHSIDKFGRVAVSQSTAN
jgi:hypothetical protein